MAADRAHDRHAFARDLFAEVLHLADARVHVVVADRLADADRHGLHVAPGQPAVGVQALVEDHHVASRLGQSVVVHRQETADVDQAVLLAGHRAAVGVRAELAQYFREERPA